MYININDLCAQYAKAMSHMDNNLQELLIKLLASIRELKVLPKHTEVITTIVYSLEKFIVNIPNRYEWDKMCIVIVDYENILFTFKEEDNTHSHYLEVIDELARLGR